MSKVKEWATDLAEGYLDELATDIDTKKITLQEGLDQAVKSNVNFGLLGFNNENKNILIDELTEYFENSEKISNKTGSIVLKISFWSTNAISKSNW